MSEAHRKLNIRAGLASVAVAIALVGLKIWAFASTGSLAVAASLTDSALDFLASLSGVFAIIYALKPADDDHAFGHSSAEDLAALGQSLLVLVSVCAILWSVVMRIMSDDAASLTREPIGIFVMCISALLTGLLVLLQTRVARETGNIVVAADRMHYLADFLPTIGALIALLASSAFGISSIDTIVAIVAALILCVGGYRIGRRAFDALMDRRADPELLAQISKIVENWPGVEGFHDLKSRTAGAVTFIQIHIEIDGNLTLHDAHSIGAALRREILKCAPRLDVIIHKDPA